MGPAGPPGPQRALPGVYTLSNASAGNQVAAYVRASNGNITRHGRFGTGGSGLDAGLGSQGALVFDARTQRFFNVNPGDNSITMSSIDSDGRLAMLSTIASGGIRPISITVRDNVVYVVNRGDVAATPVGANISGFLVQGDNLVAIPGSTQPLSSSETDVRPTQISFTPDGSHLVVAERFANTLSTFAVINGVAQAGNFQGSAGVQPFAFDFSPEGFMVVAEVGGTTPGASTVSSYSISNDGVLTPITSALATNQTAACWLVMAGGTAYIANAASATITGVVVAENGALSLHDASGVTAATGAGAIDVAVSPDRGFLYSLAGGPDAIHIFQINADGSLTSLPPMNGLPGAAAGLVVR